MYNILRIFVLFSGHISSPRMSHASRLPHFLPHKVSQIKSSQSWLAHTGALDFQIWLGVVFYDLVQCHRPKEILLQAAKCTNLGVLFGLVTFIYT